MTWRRELPPLPPAPDARTLVLLAVCRATEGKVGTLTDVREVFGFTGLYEGDVMELLAALDGEGLLVLDEEEEEASVTLTEAGAAWAAANHRAWDTYS